MAEKTAVVKQVDGVTLIAKGNSGHWVVMDGNKDIGGGEAGSAPKELLLFALGGCTAFDVITILKKKRVPVENVEIRLKGKESDEHPRVFTDVHVEYIVYGDGINPKDVERAIELSVTKYCSVSAMISKAANLTHSYRIEPSKVKVAAAEPVTN